MESIPEKHIDQNPLQRLLERPSLPYILPLVLFLLLTGPVYFFPTSEPLFYTLKTILVGVILWHWRREYTADISPRLTLGDWMAAFFCGLLVLVIWILPDGYLFQFGQNSGFDPYALGGSRAGAWGLIAVRLMGAAVVVPFMEELFWRSFLMRYLINPDFRSVPLGAFTWFSFVGVAVLFGLEHHRIIEGIVAGVLFNLLLVRRKKLKAAIVAHGITNLALGVYVLATGSWMFW